MIQSQVGSSKYTCMDLRLSGVREDHHQDVYLFCFSCSCSSCCTLSYLSVCIEHIMPVCPQGCTVHVYLYTGWGIKCEFFEMRVEENGNTECKLMNSVAGRVQL